MPHRRWLSVLLLGLACSRPSDETPGIALSSCRLEGLGVEARCGRHVVFENRDSKQGREISLNLAVVPALASSPRPDPLFILVGGPGQAATVAGAQVARALSRVRRYRDIVLVDQRGTGDSGALTCEDDAPSLSERFAPVADLEAIRRCHEDLKADTTQYVTPVAMDDLDEIRQALGYDTINLWGGSYGTRAALVYLRRHPRSTRSLVLDGLAPTALKLPLFVGRDSQRALGLLLDDCEGDSDCKARFPQLRQQLEALLSSVEASPPTVSVDHPTTGKPIEVQIQREGLASVLLNLLYVPELTSLIPLSVDQASDGNYRSFIAQAEAFSQGVKLSAGMFLSVVCAEDLPQISEAEIARHTQGTFLGPEWLRRLKQECSNWRAAVLPEAYFEPVVSDVPALLLSGNLDPVTPPSWAEEVATGFPNSRHVVVQGAGHGVTPIGCVPELIADFLEHQQPSDLNVDCLEARQRPAFFVALAGPKP